MHFLGCIVKFNWLKLFWVHKYKNQIGPKKVCFNFYGLPALFMTQFQTRFSGPSENGEENYFSNPWHNIYHLIAFLCTFQIWGALEVKKVLWCPCHKWNMVKLSDGSDFNICLSSDIASKLFLWTKGELLFYFKVINFNCSISHTRSCLLPTDCFLKMLI